ncbi:hypothetical protein EIY89_09325 [Shewanella algae]|nr:hypothetical protein EIY89_09325 [Shewanella algae]
MAAFLVVEMIKPHLNGKSGEQKWHFGYQLWQQNGNWKRSLFSRLKSCIVTAIHGSAGTRGR